MDIKEQIDLRIGYGLESVIVEDVTNGITYTENFWGSTIPWFHRFNQRRAERKAIKRALKKIADKLYTDHQKMLADL